MKNTALILPRLLASGACFWAALGLLAAVAFGPPPAQAEVTEAWVHRYNAPVNGRDVAQAVAMDGNGNVVVTGSSATIKYLADGTGVWTNAGGTSLAVDGSGNVVVTGSSYGGLDSEGNDYDDYYTAKYAATSGALLWEKRYNRALSWYRAAQAVVAVDSSGNVVVAGSSYNGTNTDYYTAKFAAADGSLLWEKHYNGPSNTYDDARALALDGNGNVVITGFSQGDYYTAKYAAADGAVLWEKGYNGDYLTALMVDGSGNVLVTGASENGPPLYGSDYYTARYAAADGALLWEQRYNNGPGNYRDEAQAVAVDAHGNVVVTGYSWGSFDNFGNPNADYYTAKYAAGDGALLWEQRYNGPGNAPDDFAYAIAVDGSGNVVVTGSSSVMGYPCYTAKYAAADGALLWETRSDGGGAIAIDSSGNVVVTGSSYGGGESSLDCYTAKFAATNGALLWEKRYNGPASRSDGASAVAVDVSGNVVITGSSDTTNGDPDFYTAKYAAADGALLWEKRYNGPANRIDMARAVGVDGSGNVVVTGYSLSRTSVDYYTAKYAAVDGALLWEKYYNGPANSYDYANAVAVDGSGNVVVTGYSFDDFYTAKYAAADGTLLWEKRYNGPANSYDSAVSVAVDSSGNVVVTGVSDAGRTIWDHVVGGDYYTAKYAAANGALLWEKRYNGPANGNDSVTTPRCLALGPNGMVAITGTSSDDYATVVYRDDVYPISIALVPTGIRLRFTGVPGRSYTIERALAVTGPWSTINTQTAPASALLEYLDATPLPGPAFYRTVTP